MITQRCQHALFVSNDWNGTLLLKSRALHGMILIATATRSIEPSSLASPFTTKCWNEALKNDTKCKFLANGITSFSLHFSICWWNPLKPVLLGSLYLLKLISVVLHVLSRDSPHIQARIVSQVWAWCHDCHWPCSLQKTFQLFPFLPSFLFVFCIEGTSSVKTPSY